MVKCHFQRSIVSLHSNCGEIQNTFLTPDKVQNVLICGSHYFDEMQYTGEHVKWPENMNGE